MLKIDIQLFGGRGAAGGSKKSGGASPSGDGAILDTKAQHTIETVYHEQRGWKKGHYEDEVLEATTDGKGNINFSYASGGKFEKSAKTNIRNNVTYKLSAGAVNGTSFGLNWDKVKSISGQTYNMRQEAKENGLKFDGSTKHWVRR